MHYIKHSQAEINLKNRLVEYFLAIFALPVSFACFCELCFCEKFIETNVFSVLKNYTQSRDCRVLVKWDCGVFHFIDV